jgi:hypothetical protein
MAPPDGLLRPVEVANDIVGGYHMHHYSAVELLLIVPISSTGEGME